MLSLEAVLFSLLLNVTVRFVCMDFNTIIFQELHAVGFLWGE
jgi:hypothetical protein